MVVKICQNTNEAIAAAAFGLSAKRKNGGAGIDSWFPYYAGFSYEFARHVLQLLCYGSGDGSTLSVLDPWNGSGTTTAAAFHLGHKPLGFDLNPATVVLANAKLATRSDVDQLERNMRAVVSEARAFAGKHGSPVKDPLLRWLPPKASAFARATLVALCHREGTSEAAHLQPQYALVAACIANALRPFAVDCSRSNTSWQHPKTGTRYLRLQAIEERLVEEVRHIQHTAQQCCGARRRRILTQVGDARSLPLPDCSIDVILSSPPYCTRIDYAKQTQFELALLQSVDESEFRPVRKALMGTTTIRETRDSTNHLPASIRDLLDRIGSHPSHRSKSYYARNIAQYFTDAFAAVREIKRTLKPNGLAALVLQNSFYKEIPIHLSALFCDIACEIGLSARIIAKQPVRKTMTSVNTRARKYCNSRKYSEDILVLENN